MWKRTYLLTAMTAAMVLLSVPPWAADTTPARQQAQEQVYGSQLMTAQERAAYRTKMRSAKTLQEREQIRLDHHKAMQARAQAQGLTLPDTPPAMGGGVGPGGGGMGPGGGGMGHGGGRNR